MRPTRGQHRYYSIRLPTRNPEEPKFFRPAYLANLVSAQLPSMEGVVAKLERGTRVADAGCGLGVSTIIMAKAFPKSQVVGFDYPPNRSSGRVMTR